LKPLFFAFRSGAAPASLSYPGVPVATSRAVTVLLDGPR